MAEHTNKSDPQPRHKTESPLTYLVIYIVLMLWLALTIGLSYVDMGRHWNNAIAMTIGLIKGVLIVLFFMHLLRSGWLMWFFAGAGFLWLGILIVLGMSDYLTRNHPDGVNPKGEPVFLHSPHRLPERPTYVPVENPRKE